MRGAFGLGVRIVAAMMAASALALSASAAQARSPDMSTPEARARDRAIIRQLNQNELARVRRRDARWAAEARESDRAQADYARRRAQYDRDMAAWRRAVAACRAGVYSACGR